MADSKISALPSGGALQDTDAFVIARAGSTLQVLWSSMSIAALTERVASYIIRESGGNYFAESPVGLPTVGSNADAAAVLTSCLNNINATTTPRGTIIFEPNKTFTWSSVPSIRRTYASGGSDDKKWLRILGSGGSVISLTSSGPRFLDVNRQADHDGFCGIEIGNFSFDCNSLYSDNHVIFGTKVAGTDNKQRVNLQRLWIHDCHCYEVPVGTTGTPRAAIWFKIAHLGASEATQNFIEDVLIQRVRCDGGATEILFAGQPIAVGTNIRGDRITVEDCYWDSGQNPDGTYDPGTGIQIGGGMFSDRVRISRCEMRRSHDNGYEMNCIRDLVLRDCVAADCWEEGYYVMNFNHVGNDAAFDRLQLVVYDNCVAEETISTTNQNRGWVLQTNANHQGTMIFRNCKHVVKVQQSQQFGQAMYFGSPGTGQIERIVLDGCSFEMWLDSAASAIDVSAIFMYRGPREFIIRDTQLIFRGNKGGAGAYTIKALDLSSSGLTTVLDWDGLQIIDLTTARSTNTTWAARIGDWSGNGVSTFLGTIRRLRIVPGSDTAPRGIQISAAADVTLGKLLVEDCDFSNLASDNGLVTWETAGENDATVWIRDFKDRTTYPAEITFTPAATTVAAQYKGNRAGLMSVTGGTLTLIEVSTDNSTWRTVASATNVSFFIDNGMWVRITYTSAPTCRVLPMR